MRLIAIASCALMGAVLAGCRPPKASMQVDAALGPLVPPDTVVMVGAEIEKLKNTPVYQKHFASRDFPQLDEFSRRTGLDARKDIWELLFVSNGTEGLMMGRGKFSSSDLEPRLEKEGVERFGYKGYRMFGDENGAVLFINSSTAIVGRTAALRKLLDLRTENKLGIPQAMQQQVSKLPANAQFWAVFAGARVTTPFAEGSALGNVNRMLASLQSGTFSVDLTNGFFANANGVCNTSQDAQQIRDAVKALVGIGRLSTKSDQPDMLKVYDGIQVFNDQQNVKVDIRVEERIVDQFLRTWLR
jgi:hypothetical protein